MDFRKFAPKALISGAIKVSRPASPLGAASLEVLKAHPVPNTTQTTTTSDRDLTIGKPNSRARCFIALVPIATPVPRSAHIPITEPGESRPVRHLEPALPTPDPISPHWWAVHTNENRLTMLLTDFLEYRSSLRQSPLTVHVTKSNVDCFLAWMKKSYRVSTIPDLRRDHLLSWLRDLGKRMERWGRPPKPATITKNIESVRVFLAWLAKRDLVSFHPSNQVECVKISS